MAYIIIQVDSSKLIAPFLDKLVKNDEGSILWSRGELLNLKQESLNFTQPSPLFSSFLQQERSDHHLATPPPPLGTTGSPDRVVRFKSPKRLTSLSLKNRISSGS